MSGCATSRRRGSCPNCRLLEPAAARENCNDWARFPSPVYGRRCRSPRFLILERAVQEWEAGGSDRRMREDRVSTLKMDTQSASFALIRHDWISAGTRRISAASGRGTFSRKREKGRARQLLRPSIVGRCGRAVAPATGASALHFLRYVKNRSLCAPIVTLRAAPTRRGTVNLGFRFPASPLLRTPARAAGSILVGPDRTLPMPQSEVNHGECIVR